MPSDRQRRKTEVMIKMTKLGYNGLSRGVPDMVFTKGNKLVFVEVKPLWRLGAKNAGLRPATLRVKKLVEDAGHEFRVEYVP